jgi:16S rRNA (guanine(966)-N(2))-methyltransferase RsmD
MRVISGTAKGRRLTPPSDRRVRPTSDRVKEALFSILNSFCGDLEGLLVLDLFAGTGNLGIEALSRGSDSAVFVDNHRSSVSLINANIRSTGFDKQSEVMQSDVFQALSRLSDAGRKFDLVFADPPYGHGLPEKLLEKLASTHLLTEGAILIVESEVKEVLPLTEVNMNLLERRIYGDTAITFIEFID